MMAPARKIQYEKALSLGKATSRAPICSGMMKLKNAALSGMIARKIMVVACIVNISLYCGAVRTSLFGTMSWRRIRRASTPPTEEEEQGRDAVQKADALVVDGRQPAHQAGLRGGPPEHESLRRGAFVLAEKSGFSQCVCHGR